MEPLPYTGAPLQVPGLEPFEPVHSEGVVNFPEACGLRDQLGLLPVEEVPEGLHRLRWHV